MSAAPSPLALSIAEHLANQGNLYWTSSATTAPEEVIRTALLIDEVLLPRLSTHADLIEGALNGIPNWGGMMEVLKEMRPDSDTP